MQILSLEDELKRIDGVPYAIDFYQDFSTVVLENSENGICIPEIIEEIMNPRMINVQQQSYNPSLEERQRSMEFWDLVERERKKEIKAEKKWKKHHGKVSGKQACRNFECIYEELTGGGSI